MFLRKIDMISPPITLSYKGEDKHSSIFSGILTAIAYIIVFIFGVYYALEFINRENPTAYFFNRYIEDAGTFPLNASSMFNFIQLIHTDSNKPVAMDFTAFRIVGFDEVQPDTYTHSDDKTTEAKRQPIEFNHWLYGPCNNSSDTAGIGHLIDFDYFEQSACIRKYYDKSAGKYYNTGDPKFKWPVILKGCSHPDRTYYGVIVEKCVDDESHKLSGYEKCKTDDEINAIIKQHSIYMQLIDQFSDILNYKNPFRKYFYTVTNSLDETIFGINHLNFNPATTVTHNGFFFDNIVTEHSYFFTQNSQQVISTNTQKCLNGFFFWMQNTLQYYERNYKRLQDIFSDIGGISSIVLVMAEIINSLVSGYIVLYDTEDLIFSTEDKNNFNNSLKRTPTIFKKHNQIMNNPPRRQFNNYNQQQQQQPQSSSNYQRLLKDGVVIYQNSKVKDEKQEQYNNLFEKRNNMISNKYQGNFTYKNTEKEQIYQQTNSRRNIFNRNAGNNNIRQYRGKGGLESQKIYNDKRFDKEIEEEGDDQKKEKTIKKITWFDFVKFIVCCGKYSPKLTYYDDFRNEILSEENLVQNYLNIYKLLKANNIETKNSIQDIKMSIMDNEVK